GRRRFRLLQPDALGAARGRRARGPAAGGGIESDLRGGRQRRGRAGRGQLDGRGQAGQPPRDRGLRRQGGLMIRIVRTGLTGAVVLLTAVVLTGCTGDDDPSPTGTGSATGGASESSVPSMTRAEL